MKKVFALSLISVSIALVLTGCNTISGIGRDVQKVGQVVTGAGGR
jgi:predicted small secreted protein